MVSDSNKNFTLLIVDDEPEVARVLERSLRKNLFDENIILSHNSLDALKLIKKQKPQVVVIDLTLDLNEGPTSGLNLIEEIRNYDESIRILVLTSHSQKEYGHEALKRGALSFLNKPADSNLLMSLIKDGFKTTSILRDHKKLKENLSLEDNVLGLKSRSPLMSKVTETLSYAVKNNQPVLITGETGTGKGVIARLIHKHSDRHNNNFIRYQSNFSSGDLIASELFGHRKGSFTGAQEDRIGLIKEANNGSLFIDEIDSLPKETQVVLLEVLQEKNFRQVGSNKLEKSDFRLISAMNRNPKDLVNKGIIRQDFFHRISHITVHLPALRERSEDIELLSEDFFQSIVSKNNLKLRGFEQNALKRLTSYNWPGNIRELESTIERACHLSSFRGHEKIKREDLGIEDEIVIDNQIGLFRDKVRKYEEELVIKALSITDNNQVKAAELLGLDRTVLRRIITRTKNL